MADIIDDANERAEDYLNEALARRAPTLEPTGRCHNCGEYLDDRVPGDNVLFCDADCRDDWQVREDAKQRTRG